VTLPISIRPEAEAEIERAHTWYEDRRPGLGQEFLLALDAVLLRAAETPDTFPLIARRTHRAVLRRFPYLVFFVVEQERLVVTALFHGHRDPEQWADRVREHSRSLARSPVLVP